MGPPAENKNMVININRDIFLLLFKLFLVFLVILALLRILPYGGLALTPLILGILLSVLLNPLVVRLEGRGLSRTAAVVLVMAAISMAIAALLSLLAPTIAHQVENLSGLVKNETPTALLGKLRALLNRHLPWLNHSGIISQIMARAEKFLYAMINQSIRLLPSIIPVVITLVLIPFMTFFLLKDGRRLKHSFVRILPNRYFEMGISLLHKIDCQLGSYIRGQMLVSLCIGILSITALAILKVPYFFLIGAAAGLANMIPYFGPIVGAIPAIILNIIDKGSIRAALPVIVAFLVIRFIDDTLVSPNILGHSLEIHPLLVIIVIFTGGEMFGIMGLLLCIPVTGIIKVTISELIWNFKHYRVLRGGD
jgi:putative permease